MFAKNGSGKKGFLWGVLFCSCLSALPLSAAAGDDWQYWHETEIEVRLPGDYTFQADAEQRIRDDFSDLFLYNFGGGFLWEPAEFFEIGPFFRYEHEKEADGDHVNENRWFLEATLKQALGGLKLSDRSRMEYRNKNTSDSWRYRNRLKASYPLPFKKVRTAPFVADEIFWDITNHVLNQNRFSAGFEFGLNRYANLKVYYLMRSVKRGGDWDDEQVLGTGISFKV